MYGYKPSSGWTLSEFCWDSIRLEAHKVELEKGTEHSTRFTDETSEESTNDQPWESVVDATLSQQCKVAPKLYPPKSCVADGCKSPRMEKERGGIRTRALTCEAHINMLELLVDRKMQRECQVPAAPTCPPDPTSFCGATYRLA